MACWLHGSTEVAIATHLVNWRGFVFNVIVSFNIDINCILLIKARNIVEYLFI